MKRALQVGGVGLVVLSVVLLFRGLLQFIMPPTFGSVARIAIRPKPTGATIAKLDPAWLQTQIEKLQSKQVLYEVIKRLDLNKDWGEKYKEGRLSAEVTYALLRNNLEIRQARNSQLIEIRAFSDNPTEAAAIANGIAIVYLDQQAILHREKVESQITKDSIVEIIDQAVANFRPVIPNPVLKILTPVAGLSVGFIGVILFMLGMKMKSSAKKSPPPLPA